MNPAQIIVTFTAMQLSNVISDRFLWRKGPTGAQGPLKPRRGAHPGLGGRPRGSEKKWGSEGASFTTEYSSLRFYRKEGTLFN